jgi:4-amino-4-deoxy-L-arabinose transferase
MAHGLTAGLSSGRQRAFNIASGLMILFPVIATAIVLFWQYGIIIHDAPLFSNPWKIVLFVCSMSGFAALLFVSIRSTDVITKLTCFALSPLMFYASAHALTPDQAVRRNSPCPFIESTAHFVTADTIVVSASTPIKSVCWALKRSDVFLLDEEGELSYGFGQETAKHRHLSFQDFGRMIAENKGRRTVLLYLDERRFKRWKQRLPEPASVEDSGPDGYIMAVY